MRQHLKLSAASVWDCDDGNWEFYVEDLRVCVTVHYLAGIEPSSHRSQLSCCEIVLSECLQLQCFLIEEANGAQLFLNIYCIFLSNQHLTIPAHISSIHAHEPSIAKLFIVQSVTVLIAPADHSISISPHNGINSLESESIRFDNLIYILFAGYNAFSIKLALVKVCSNISECGEPIAELIDVHNFGE